jgi:hypothetical protein
MAVQGGFSALGTGTLGLGPPRRLPGRWPGQLSSAQVPVSPAIRGAAHMPVGVNRLGLGAGSPELECPGQHHWQAAAAAPHAVHNADGAPQWCLPPRHRGRSARPAVACRRRPMARLVLLDLLRARVRMPAAPRAGPPAAPARATAQLANVAGGRMLTCRPASRGGCCPARQCPCQAATANDTEPL